MCSDGVETESREVELSWTERIGEVDFARVEEEGLKNIQTRNEHAGEVRRNRFPMGPINPYMAAKFLPNSLSFFHSLNFLTPSQRERADPKVNERVCHVKTGYYTRTQPWELKIRYTPPEDGHPLE